MKDRITETGADEWLQGVRGGQGGRMVGVAIEGDNT